MDDKLVPNTYKYRGVIYAYFFKRKLER